ncbi:MAG: hypothetical protein ACRERV_08080 [Methylococcales bacterium]
MMNRLKLSIVLAPLALFLVIGAYIYSLWSVERKKTNDLPVDGVSMMMRDLLRFHEKRGGFPNNLRNLEGVVWEKKERNFSIDDRALNHRNYYYFYSRVSDHQFTLWAIPAGKEREEAPSWYLVVTPDICRRWKGAALPYEQISHIDPNPSVKQLGSFGLIEQPQVNFKPARDSTLIKGRDSGYQPRIDSKTEIK